MKFLCIILDIGALFFFVFWFTEIDEYYGDVKYERIAILNALAAYYTYLGKIETKQSKKDEHFANATHCYNRATRIDRLEPSTWIGKGKIIYSFWNHFLIGMMWGN